MSRDRLEQAEAWFARNGKWALLFAWLPVVGDPLTVAAGVLRTHIIPFIVLVAAGKLARYLLIAGDRSGSQILHLYEVLIVRCLMGSSRSFLP